MVNTRSRKTQVKVAPRASQQKGPVSYLPDDEVETLAINYHKWLVGEQQNLTDDQRAKEIGLQAAAQVQEMEAKTPGSSGNTRVCMLCHELCVNRYELIRHALIHTPSHYWPYSCDQCGKRFVQKRPLGIHIKIAHEGGHFTCRLVLEEGRDGKLPVVCGEMITSDSSATRHRQQWHGWPTKDERKQGFPLLKHLSEDEPAEVVLGRRAPGIPVDREGPRKPAKNPKAAPKKKTTTRTSAKKAAQKTTMQAKKQATKTKLARRPTRKAAKPAIILSDDEDSDIDCDSMDIDEPPCSSPLTDYSRSETAVADETSFDTASTIVDDLDTAAKSDDKYTGEKAPANMVGLANSDVAAAVEALLFLSNSGAPKHTSLSCASTPRTPPTSASAQCTLSAARWSPPSNGLYVNCAAMDFQEGTESARFPEASSHTSYSYSYPPVPPPRHQY